jgi:hypothetical protein
MADQLKVERPSPAQDRVVRIDRDVVAALQRRAEPFADSFNSVLRRLLDLPPIGTRGELRSQARLLANMRQTAGAAQSGRFLHAGCWFRAFPEDGNYFGVIDGQLVSVPMLADGAPEVDADGPNIVDVAWFGDSPQDLATLAAINEAFNTAFTPASFAGRC